jgi:hypothetical protein
LLERCATVVNAVRIFSRIRAFSVSGVHYIFALVVLVRLVALARLSASAFLLPSRGDMHFYNDWAQRIVNGQWTDHLAFYGLPLYPYFLALIYECFGYGPYIPALLQTFADAGTAAIIYCLVIRVFPSDLLTVPALSTRSGFSYLAKNQREFAGAIAAVGWALFVPAQVYSIILMPTSWFVFVFWFVVWRIVQARHGPGARECLLLGGLIGFTAMAVATILFLVPVVFAALVLKDNTAIKARVLGATLLLMGVIAGTSPCWLHNYFVARDPVILSAHSGINFWIGNNPEANGYPRLPPGLRAGQAAMLEDSISSAEAAAGQSLKRSEVSKYWSAKARAYITQHFADWLRLLGRKVRNFCSAFQYDDLSLVTTFREHGVVFPGLYFGLVAAVGLAGILPAVYLSPQSRWIGFAILLHLGALLPVFVTERYRLAAVPGLLIFGAIGLSIFWHACATSRFGTAMLYAALLIISAILVSWPQREPALWALDAYNSGWQALESGNLVRAEQKLTLARSYVPANAETSFAFGNLRLAQGDRESAAAFYREAVAIDPRHKSALNNLGVIALETHDLAGARFLFEQALLRDPRSGKAHFLLAKTCLAANDVASAKAELAKALAISPSQPEFLDLQREIAQRK